MSTPSTPGAATAPSVAAPSHTKPEGLILVKGHPEQGSGNEIFGIWPSGFTRMVTEAEFQLWGSPEPDVQIKFGDDGLFNQLAAYDRALRA